MTRQQKEGEEEKKEDLELKIKFKFEAATSGLSNYHLNPLKRLLQPEPELDLESKSKLKQNALTTIDYLLSINDEVNPSSAHKRNLIMCLTQLSESCSQRLNRKPLTFLEMTREDILFYLNKSRKNEVIDPMYKWIGTFNLRRSYLFRFFKWLYNPNLEPGKRPNPEHVLISPFLRERKSQFTSQLTCGLKKTIGAII